MLGMQWKQFAFEFCDADAGREKWNLQVMAVTKKGGSFSVRKNKIRMKQSLWEEDFPHSALYLLMTMETLLSTDLGFTNKFQQVSKFINIEFVT